VRHFGSRGAKRALKKSSGAAKTRDQRVIDPFAIAKDRLGKFLALVSRRRRRRCRLRLRLRVRVRARPLEFPQRKT